VWFTPFQKLQFAPCGVRIIKNTFAIEIGIKLREMVMIPDFLSLSCTSISIDQSIFKIKKNEKNGH
jgi:hypothetical protein